MTFHTPAAQRWADSALALLLLVILLVPMLAVGGTAYLAALAAGAVMLGVAAARSWSLLRPCRLELGPEALRIGLRKIPYREVVLLRVGHVRAVTFASGSVPLTIERGGALDPSIWLRRDDADRALAALRARCERAAAMDSAGRDHLPAHAEAKNAASHRLARRWRRRGLASLALSAAVGVAAVKLVLQSLQGSATTGDWVKFTAALSMVSGGFAAGWAALRRARKHAAAIDTSDRQGRE